MILARREEVVKELQLIERQWISTTIGSRWIRTPAAGALRCNRDMHMRLRRVPNNKG